ncbi:MAG: DUF115 domain-containing protein [Spirochaeta sp.]|nr:DUF115 domain-containing protein [Spirochaeta sp.]
MSHTGSLLQRNLRALLAGGGGANKATVAKVAASQASQRLQIEASRVGGMSEPTATLNVSAAQGEQETPEGMPNQEGALLLHSRYRPMSEARKFARGTEIESCDYMLLYGFGLGYEAEALLEAAPQLELRIIEPDPALLYSAFSARDLSTLLYSAHVSIVCEDSVAEAVDRLDYLPFFFPNLRTTSLRARLPADEQYFKSFARSLERFIAAAGNDYRACAAYGLRWCVNTIRNLALLERAELYTEPAPTPDWTIVGAGPSADRAVQRQHSVSTIFCDTAVPAAAAYAYSRLTAVSIDPQPISHLHYLGVSLKNIHLFADLGSHHNLLRKFPHITFISSGHPLHTYLHSQGIPIGPRLVRGGSVSETALRIAHYSGATAIQLYGLDFAYLAEKSYVAGSWIDSYLRIRSNRLNSISDQNYAFLQQRNAVRCSGVTHEHQPPTYHTELLNEYREAFLATAKELGFTYQAAKSFDAPGRLHADRRVSPSHGATPDSPTATYRRVKDVLQKLKQDLTAFHIPTDDSRLSSTYRTLGAAGAALVPAAIFYHERRGLSRCEAMKTSCDLMIMEISQFSGDDT